MGSTLLTAPPLAFDFTSSLTPARYGVRNGHRFVGFKDAGNTEAFWSNFMPEGYVGSGLSVTIAWMAASATTGDVDWDVAFERLAAGGQDLDSDNFNAPKTSISTTTHADSGKLTYTIISFSAAEAANLQPLEKFRIRLRRLGDNGTDDMVGEAQVVDIQVGQIASAGTLTVEEQDGNPSVAGVRVIKFDNTTVTDDGGDTVSVASGGGGGGGFFSDGVGTNAGFGKGTVAPRADGTNGLAQGSNATSGGAQGVSFGLNIDNYGVNAFFHGESLDTPELGYGPNETFVQGRDIVVPYWQANALFQGRRLYAGNPGPFTGEPLVTSGTDDPVFCQGVDITLNWYGYYDSGGGNNYVYNGAAFVWGTDHVIDNTTPSSSGNSTLVNMGRANDLMDCGGFITVIGEQNVLTDCFNSSEVTTLMGHDNILTDVFGGWFFANNSSFLSGRNNTIVMGNRHNIDSYSGSLLIGLFGQQHHVNWGSASASTAPVFIFGDSGTNGFVRLNHYIFVFSGGASTTVENNKGRSQWAFTVRAGTTNNTITPLNVGFFRPETNRTYHIRAEAVAYDTGNNNQAACFAIDTVLVYSTAHTGQTVLVPSGPINMPGQNSGGVSATWSAALVIQGTGGIAVQVIGSATELVYWTARIAALGAGSSAL